jgi:4-amino-4-deoxy-L-arabinose transferase-like glycosyltransferase
MNKIVNSIIFILALINRIRHKEYLLLSIILIFGFVVRLYKIENPIADWHSWRQADTASVSRVYVQKGINIFYPRYHDISSIQTGHFNPEGYRFVEFPIYNAAHALLYQTVPNIGFEVWGRILSIFLSLVSTYTVFLIGKRFLSSWGGVVSAFFFAFIPFNVYYSRVILPEPLAVLFILTSLWQFIKFIDNDKLISLLISSIFFALGILIKPFVGFYAITMIYLLTQKQSNRQIFNNIKYYIALFIAVTPFLLWRNWMGNFPAGIPFYKWAFNGSGIRFKPSFWYWIFAERIGKLILGVWGTVPLAFAAVNYKKNQAFIHSLILGVVFYVTLVASANVMHDYYQVLIIPAISITLAYGVITMWKTRVFNKYATRSLMAFSVFVMFVAGSVQVKEYYHVNRPELITAGKYVDENTEENALVIAPYNGDTAFLYQTNRWGWPYVDREISELIGKGADYYVSVNYDERTKELMEEYEVIEENKEFVVIKLVKNQDR